MTKTYLQPKHLKVFAIIGLSFFNSILVFLFVSIINWDYHIILKTFLLFSCFTFWIMLNFALIEILLEKVTITKESITLKSLFKRKSIQINEIKGYQLKNKNIILISNKIENKDISFSDNLVGEGKIIDYFVSNNQEKEKPTQRNKWNN